MKILVLNSGSSSIKYQVFTMPEEKVAAKGMLERIGEKTSQLTHEAGGKSHECAARAHNHGEGLERIAAVLTDPEHGVISSLSEISAVGHRVVHGGELFSKSTKVNAGVIKAVRKNCPLAPLHNPPNLAGIEAVSRLMKKVPQVAVFDTAFHQTIPPAAYLYALPYGLYRKHHIRRYGFHGTSHRYVAERTCSLAGKNPGRMNVITCHLGNGCSITAVRGGVSVDTSMGLTPLEGLVMGTRTGDMDPAIIFFLAEHEGMGLDDINSLLNKKSGLLGISGLSNDVRDLLSHSGKGNRKAKLAIDIFSYRVKKYIGAYTAALGRVDALAFAGGIGENSPLVRKLICGGLRNLGISLDERRNKNARGKEGLISGPGSPVKVYVVPTNEELVIARDAFAVVSGKK